MGECYLHTVEVAGSNPARPTNPFLAGLLLLLVLALCVTPAAAQTDEDEFTAVSVRYLVLEPLGPKGITRDETIDLGIEYSLLPMISVRGGITMAQYGVAPGSVMATGGTIDEVVLSAGLRYYMSSGRMRWFTSFGIGMFLEERQEGVMDEARDADLGLMVGGGLEWTVARHFGLEVEVGLSSSSGGEPDSVFAVAVGPKFFF